MLRSIPSQTESQCSRWEHQDLNMQTVSRMKLRKGFGRRILRYELVDTRTGKSEVLLDSPAT